MWSEARKTTPVSASIPNCGWPEETRGSPPFIIIERCLVSPNGRPHVLPRRVGQGRMLAAGPQSRSSQPPEGRTGIQRRPPSQESEDATRRLSAQNQRNATPRALLQPRGEIELQCCPGFQRLLGSIVATSPAMADAAFEQFLACSMNVGFTFAQRLRDLRRRDSHLSRMPFRIQAQPGKELERRVRLKRSD